jgi:hypothetical protein
MAISSNRNQLERDKFVESGGVTAIRIKPVAATIGAGAGVASSVNDNELHKFVPGSTGAPAIIFTG